MATPFHFVYKNPGQAFTGMPAVYKLCLGKAYFIWKGKTLKGSVEQNCGDIGKLLWSEKPDHIFMPMVKYIHRYRTLTIVVDVVLQTDDPHLLLKTEKDLLAAGRNDINCLNQAWEPYVPKWLSEALAGAVVKPVKKKTQNKAITATFIPDRVDIPAPERKPVVVSNSAPGKASKLLDAFSKLNGQ